MDNKAILKKIKEGKFKVNTSGGGGGYEKVKVQIVKLDVEEAGSHKTKHSFLDLEWIQGRLCLIAHLRLKKYLPDGGMEIGYTEHIEVDQLLKADGEIALYPTYTKKDGTKKPGTLLYDLVHGIKQVEGQEDLFDADWSFDPDMFKGLVFDSHAKFLKDKTGREFVLLRTSRQMIRDEEFANQKGISNDDIEDFGKDDDEPETATVNAVDDDELPF